MSGAGNAVPSFGAVQSRSDDTQTITYPYALRQAQDKVTLLSPETLQVTAFPFIFADEVTTTVARA